MKQVKVLKKCFFIPAGQEDVQANRTATRPGQLVVVDDKQADKMIAGNVAELVQGDKPGPKASPVNKQKAVGKTR